MLLLTCNVCTTPPTHYTLPPHTMYIYAFMAPLKYGKELLFSDDTGTPVKNTKVKCFSYLNIIDKNYAYIANISIKVPQGPIIFSGKRKKYIY